MTENMLCKNSHEYVVQDGDKYIVGVTDVLINKLGKIVDFELPALGDCFAKGEIFGFLESEEFASELYIPLAGRVVEVNRNFTENFQSLNENNFRELWFFKVVSDSFDVDKNDLLPYDKYKAEAS